MKVCLATNSFWDGNSFCDYGNDGGGGGDDDDDDDDDDASGF